MVILFGMGHKNQKIGNIFDSAYTTYISMSTIQPSSTGKKNIT